MRFEHLYYNELFGLKSYMRSEHLYLNYEYFNATKYIHEECWKHASKRSFILFQIIIPFHIFWIKFPILQR